MIFNTIKTRELCLILMIFYFFNYGVGKTLAVETVPQEYLLSFSKISLFPAFNESILSNWNATKVEDNIGTVTYKIESSNSMYPHFVRLGIDGQVNYTKISIDPNNQTQVKNIYDSLGEPEIVTGNSRSEMMYGFPSKGYGFVLNDYNKLITAVIRFPVTTIPQFLDNEGKRYKPAVIENVLADSENKINIVEVKKIDFSFFAKLFDLFR